MSIPASYKETPIISEIKTDTKEFAPSVDNKLPTIETENKPPLLIPEMVNEDKIKIRLTENKFAYLIYPLNISPKDINIIRKQLDVLEELAN